MRLLLISGTYPPARAAEADHAQMLAERLAARGVEVRVLTARAGAASLATRAGATSEENGCSIWRVMRRWSWRALPRLTWLLWRYRPDVVLLHYIGWIYDDHPMITFIPTVAKLVRPGTRCITQFTNAIGSVPDRMPFPARAVRRALATLLGVNRVHYNFGTLLHDSDSIIVFSDHHRRLLTEGREANNKVILIPPPPLIPLSKAPMMTRGEGRRRLGLSEGEFVVAYFGYVYPRKGLETLGAAFRRVIEARRDIKLVIIGGPLKGAEAYYDGIQELYRELGISDSVIWTGFVVDTHDLAVYLSAADLCVLPIDIGVQLNNSSFAGAAASGLPIVTTRGPLLEAPFVHGRNALFCPPKNPPALAEAIESLVDDPALRRRLAEGALALAQEWFSWDAPIDCIMSAMPSRIAAVRTPTPTTART
jgi:glycosyltransferase involved in cell wall biosynthesis